MSDPARPAPRWIRWLVLGVVGLVVLVVLFTLVFPWIERNLSNPTIGAVRAHSLEARSATPATIGAVHAPAGLEVMPPGW